MMRTLLAVLALAVPLALQAADPEASAVQVHRVNFEKFAAAPTVVRAGNGSGTVVKSEGGRSWVLTNRHVAPSNGAHFFVLVGDRSYPAEWLAADPGHDLALLVIAAELPAVTLADKAPATGTAVRQFG